MQDAVKLFPHVLIRVSGGAFEELEFLNLREPVRLADEIRQLKEKLDEVKQSISSGLYEIIPQKKEPGIQGLLLDIRRDVFNERDIPAKTLSAAISQLPARLNEDLANYLEIKKNIDRLLVNGEEAFSKEIAQVRKKLHAMTEAETLQKGLLLSSQSLLKRIPSYMSKVSPGHKKDFQTERGLIKYISRMYAKTSPFSTFTNLAMAKPAQGSSSKTPFFWAKSSKKPGILCHIRLNNYLYEYLETLLCKIPDIYHNFLIRPNPTLKQEDKNYLFLTNNKNIEAFQRIPANPVLEVFRQLSAKEKVGVPFKDLVQEIIDNEYIDAPAQDIREYVNRLISYGFLEFNIGVSGIDPDWDIKLREVLKRIKQGGADVPLITELSETLAAIRLLADKYGKASSSNRNEILEKAFQRFRDTCFKLHEAAGLPEEERKSPGELKKSGAKEKKQAAEAEEKSADNKDQSADDKNGGNDKDEKKAQQEEVFKHRSNTYFYFKPEQIFYEDTTVDISPQVNERSLMEFISSLHNLLQHIRHFEGQWDERDKMRHFFINKYGKESCIELMTFYEDYYREFKKPETEFLEERKKAAEEPAKNEKAGPDEKGVKKEKIEFLTVPGIKERWDKNRAWLERFTALVKEETADYADVISLSLQSLKNAHRECPAEPGQTGKGCSYGSFIQFYTGRKKDGEEKLMGVLNSSFPGFGKLFSRFLHIFDESITQSMRGWNESSAGDSLLLEDCDASYFNANLHPPLLPYEVRIPGGHNSLPAENQVPVTELQVRLNETGDRLQLVHEPSRKNVYVFDLGFQGHKGRSQLFQLLEKFTMIEYLFPMPLVNALTAIWQKGEKEAAKKDNASAGVKVNPRIVYDDRIVLQRKTWYVPREKLPYKTPGESRWAYFLRVNEWKREICLPDEVFVHVVDRFRSPGPGPGDAEKPKQNVSRDDYKPQYISFANPFLIDLLEKIIKRVPDSLKIVEMLPNSRQLFKIGNNRHVTEFTLQWYTQPGGS